MLSSKVLSEPKLIFGGSFPAPDPKLGISLYGPYASRSSIRIGIVGDKETISQVAQLLERFKHTIQGPAKHPLWTQDFPGISPESPFKCILLFDNWQQNITTNEVEKLDNMQFTADRISYSVDLFAKYVTNLKEREDPPDIVVCAPPRRMMDLCIPTETEELELPYQYRGRTSRIQRKQGKTSISPDASQAILFDFMPELKDVYQAFLIRRSAENFHNLLKARVMDLRIPTQFILPYTLNVYTGSSRRRLQDVATFAWNLCVALLYKAGGRPWKLESASPGTCFVGISFYREKTAFGGKLGTSVAQVFTPEGEGLVLRGERFEWPVRKSPRLDSDAAERLLRRVLSLYAQQTRQKPARVVIHKSSKFTSDEMEGFNRSLEDIPQRDYVCIATRARRVRFFRTGYNPVLRGTLIDFEETSYLLFTKGYIPFMRIYPGPRVPRPLEILQHYGDSPIEVVCSEILALTKLNRNSADFSSNLPITLQFSKQVGTILRELPPGTAPQTEYIYYM